MPTKAVVRLTDDERRRLDRLTRVGTAHARAIQHARILLLADASDDGPAWSDEKVADALGCGAATVARVRKRLIKDGLDEAIGWINRHGSHHTDAILTEDRAAAERFLSEVDSAIVIHNASTQFADGGEFGMGAEIGIATGRLHARGPVGLEQLTTYKYRVRGSGQTRS